VTPPFVHCTPEHGRRFVPVTIKVNAAAPAVALVWEMETFAGAGGDEAEIVKGSVFEGTPELETSIFTIPAEATSRAGIAATSCVELTNVVSSGVVVAGASVIQLTTEPFTKFAPFTVRVAPGGLHAGVVFDEFVEEDKELMLGMAIVKGICEEAVVPGLTSWTFADPAMARSEAGTVAVREAATAGEATAGT
jgi:hypothetical protein